MISASMLAYLYAMKAGTCPCTTLPFSLQRAISAEQVSRYCTKPYPALSPVRLSLMILALLKGPRIEKISCVSCKILSHHLALEHRQKEWHCKVGPCHRWGRINACTCCRNSGYIVLARGIIPAEYPPRPRKPSFQQTLLSCLYQQCQLPFGVLAPSSFQKPACIALRGAGAANVSSKCGNSSRPSLSVAKPTSWVPRRTAPPEQYQNSTIMSH